MNSFLKCLFTICFSFFTIYSIGGEVRLSPLILEYTDSMQGDIDSLFGFPWETYNETRPLFNFTQLLADQKFLESRGASSEVFIEQVFLAYQRKHVNTLGNWESLIATIKLGERYLLINQLVPEAHFMYSAMGSYLLEEIAKDLEFALDQGEISRKDERTFYLVQRLSESQILVDVPIHDWEKFIHHLVEGNFSYLWKRIRYRYFPEFLSLMVAGFGLFTLFLFRKKITKTIRQRRTT